LDLIMRDDLVIPIDDVEAAIRAELDIDWTEPFVFTFEEVFMVLRDDRSVRITIRGDEVNCISDRVREERLVLVGLWVSLRAVFVICQTREASTAHTELMEIGGKGLVITDLFAS